MKSFCAPLVVCLLLVCSARAEIIVQYSFEDNLFDTGADSGIADDLTAYDPAGATAAAFAPGVVGRAVNVSRDPGKAAVLMAADSNELDLAAAWTVEAFVRPDLANTGEWDRFATKWFNAPGEFHWAFRYGNNGQDLFLNNAGPVIGAGTTGTVPLGRWSHVAMTGDSTDAATGIKLWQDGAVVGTAAYQAVTPGTNPFRIGNMDASAGQAASQFSGLVDEFVVHNVAQDLTYMQGRAAMLPAFVPPGNPASGLASFYEFEGDAPQNLADTAAEYVASSSTVDDNLSIVGTVNFVPGQVGQAADLDAGYFVAAHSADVELPASFTIEAWINPDQITAGWQRLVLNWGGGQQAYHFALEGPVLSLFIEEAVRVAAGGAPLAGQWQHIAAVLDADSLTGMVFLNGAPVGAGAFDGTLNTTAGEGLGLGDSAGAPGLPYVGLIDELALWDVALTPDQINAHFLAGAEGYGLTPIPEPGTIALLAMGMFVLLPFLRRRRN